MKAPRCGTSAAAQCIYQGAEGRTMTLRRIMNWLALAAMLAIGIVWSPVSGAAAVPEEMRSGSLLLKGGPDLSAIVAVRVATRIHAQVTGNVARVRVTQEFSNP